jgi:hypothetical protein
MVRIKGISEKLNPRFVWRRRNAETAIPAASTPMMSGQLVGMFREFLRIFAMMAVGAALQKNASAI